MNAKSINKFFLSRITTVFIILILLLAALPIPSTSAATLGFFAPSIYSNSTLLNAGNAYVSDDIYVQSTGNNKSAVYGNFGFNIPAGSTINLVEVSVEGHGTKNWRVSVSNNSGATYSAFTTVTNTPTDTITVTAGPGTLWGLTGWTAASLSNANFKVKVTSAGGSSSNIAYLDQLKVKVTYTPASVTPTTLAITSPAAGTYGGTVDLQATLTVTSGGAPLSGKTVSFSLDGYPRGDAVTNASGVATLSGVTLTTGLAGTTLNVGSYSLEASFAGDATYAFSSDTDTQVVNPRPVTVTAAAKSKVYGTNDPALTYSFAPALIGTDAFSGALARNAGEDLGAYAITQGTLALSTNYAITYVGADLTITALGITVTADDKAMHVGNPDPSFTFGVSNFVGSDTFITPPTCSVGVTHDTAGTYPIVCSGGDAGPNYTIAYTDGTLTVTDKVVLTVTADPQTVTYGDSDPAFTFAYSGFVDGDDSSVINTPPTCNVIGSHSNAGSYPSITCSGGLDDKYAFSYISGTLTVNPLSMIVTADTKSKTYGAVDPTLTYSFAPALVVGDSFSGALARSAGENVGTYAITRSSLTLGSNYTITYVGALLTINQASLTVTADDQTIGLGTADPLFTFQYDGFVNGEDASVIDTPPTCGVSVAHTTLGSYPIVCSGGSDNNYLFMPVDGTLTVVPMITGNAGIRGAILNYDDNGPKAVLSDASGNYSILVPAGWSGTVTPSLADAVFTPGSKTYGPINSNQTAQNYTAKRLFSNLSRWTSSFDLSHGWTVSDYVRTVGDVNGDGKDDLVGFGLDGVYVSLSNGSSFPAPAKWTSSFDLSHGWTVSDYVRTVGDVNGDGKADLVGFGLDGVYVAISTGSGFGPIGKWTSAFDLSHGWTVSQFVRTVGDVNGDGKDDLVGFGLDGVYVALSNGGAFGAISKWTSAFDLSHGWTVSDYVRTVGDVSGDGKADLVGFGLDGVYIAVSTGSGFSAVSKWITAFDLAHGWTVSDYVRTVGDVNGDGKADLVGFGLDGVYIAVSSGNSFSAASKWRANAFDLSHGWTVSQYVRTVGDVDGDGLVDLIGFGLDGVYIAK